MKIVQKSSRIFLSEPFALFVICFLAFGLMIPWLGYYHDEWHFIYAYASRGAQGIWDLFLFDGHPLSAWSYILSFNLLGFKPLNWHIYSFIWRYLAVLIFWLTLKALWPRHTRQAFLAALFFAIYPLFTLQVLPISYFEVWMSFFLLGLSFYFTVQSLRRPEKFWIFFGLSLLAKLGHMFTSEYTWGTELMRPLIVWFALEQGLPIREKLRKTLWICLPHFLLMGAFAGWRVLGYQSGRKEIRPNQAWFTSPLGMILGSLQNSLPDAILILITAWYEVLQPPTLFVGNRINNLLLLLTLLSGVVIFLYLYRATSQTTSPAEEKNWAKEALILGSFGLLAGLIPAYVAGYTIYLSAPPGNGRFGLGSMPGAALILTALAEMFIESRRARLALLAILAGLAIGWHNRYTNEFRDLWHLQVNFYRQLTWRVPGMLPGTALVAADPLLPPSQYRPSILATSGDYPTALAINTLYQGMPDTQNNLPYWFFPRPIDFGKQPNPQAFPLEAEHLGSEYHGTLGNALAFVFSQQRGQCLYILRPEFIPIKELPAPAIEMVWPTGFRRIDPQHKLDTRLLDTILGPEKPRQWCYYFEKADLARQAGDWETIRSLWKAAEKHGKRPRSGPEYLPFIEAYAHLNDWETALQMTRAANRLNSGMPKFLCPLWHDLQNTLPETIEKNCAAAEVQNKFGCQP